MSWSKKGRPPKENNAKARKGKLYEGALMVSMEGQPMARINKKRL